MVLLKSTIVAVSPPSTLAQPQISLGFDATIVALAVSLISTLLAGSISWAFGRSVKSIDDRMNKLETFAATTDSRQRDLELHVATNYLRIEDHIRAVSAHDAKMDSLHRKVDHLMEKLNAK